VSTSIDSELRAVFQEASEFVQPRPGLAESVRLATRRHRRRMAVAIAVVLVVAGSSYLLTAHRQSSPAASHDRPRELLTLPAYYQVQQLAVAGPYLYVLAGEDGEPGSALSAYDRATGRLIHRVSIPAAPSALAVGPGGLVWLSFYPDQNGGPSGTWLLSPDLRLRSSDPNVAQSPIVPVSRTTAFAVTQYGLVTVRMPAPGQPGHASQQVDPGTSIGPGQNTAPGVWAGMLDGRLVAQVTNGYGFDSHLVIAGQPSHTFGGSTLYQAGSVTSTGSSLWVEMFAVRNSYADSSGPLVRLNGQLRPTTPESVRSSAVLTRTENVWSAGNTVWAATAAPGHSLVCFAAGSQIGPVTTLPVSGQVAALAATPDTVYVTTTPRHTDDNFSVTSYPVPGACH
jgi:hypothetical protein